MKEKRPLIKSQTVCFKCSPEFAVILKELAQKKGLSQSNLIEFLVRKESEK